MAVYLSVEHRLHLDLARKVELLGCRSRALVPLFEDLPEAHGVDLNELLEMKDREIRIKSSTT